MKMNVLKAAALALLGIMGLVAGGCSGPRMGTYDLRVAPGASLKESGRMPQVEVLLVGVKAADVEEWKSHSVDSIFSGSSGVRADAKDYSKTIMFSADQPGPTVVKANDPIWKVWRERGVTHLFVFANSLGIRKNQTGPDLRRKVLPLTTNYWKTDTIDIVVNSSGIDVPTPMETPK